MNTNDTTTNAAPETFLPIRCTSGGERGNKGAGDKFNYLMPKTVFMELVGVVFDKEMENSKDGNVASGGAVSQFLHSYGVSAGRLESSGRNPFPPMKKVNVVQTEAGELYDLVPAEFTQECANVWLEVLAFRKPREVGTRKTAKEVKMEAVLDLLKLPNITWEQVKPAYPDITKEELEAYKVKLAATVVETPAA